jgi:hypothetical protein
MKLSVFEKMRLRIAYKFFDLALACMPERFRLYVKHPIVVLLVEAKKRLEALR